MNVPFFLSKSAEMYCNISLVFRLFYLHHVRLYSTCCICLARLACGVQILTALVYVKYVLLVGISGILSIQRRRWYGGNNMHGAPQKPINNTPALNRAITRNRISDYLSPWFDPSRLRRCGDCCHFRFVWLASLCCIKYRNDIFCIF